MSNLNANAKPFVFNPNAGSFTPSTSPVPPSESSPKHSQIPPQLSPSPEPTTTPTTVESWEDEVTETAYNNSDNHQHRTTTTTTTRNAEYNSHNEEDKESDITASNIVPSNSIRSSTLLSSSSSDSVSSPVSPSPSPSVPAPSSSPSIDDLSSAVAGLALDADEAAELAAAEAEEALQQRNARLAAAAPKVHDEREHINIVFIGHVDAGKSTISGQILLLTGQVDERTIAKYEKEAKDKNRESWYLAYIMDTNEEERAKGKTVEVGRAHFSTAKKRFTLLDAPGHKNYVPNMIGGASQADVGVLVISARRGEFEAGFDRGGQTREHAMLAKTLGLQKLVVLVNKMDEKEVSWRKERYDQIEAALGPFLKICGFNLKTDVVFIPGSGYTAANIRDPVSASVCPWYTSRRSLFQVLDDFPPMIRDASGPLRLPIMARYKEMGALFCLGKLESGTLYKDRKLLMMPNKVEVYCTGIYLDEEEVDMAKPGENVLVKVKGIEEDDVHEGFVLSYLESATKRTSLFEGMIVVAGELLEHKPIIAVGYEAMFHAHVATCECVITSIVAGLDKKTGQPLPQKPRFLRPGDVANVRVRLEQSMAIELFKEVPSLGRFTIRDEGKTIAIGKITKIKDEP